MEWTGERLETFIYNENTIEHLHRYAMAINYVAGKVVLDIASGEGYGCNLLAKYADYVYGVDIDENTIVSARKKYKSKNIEFKRGSADLIPLENETVDIVVSFETLEHHDKHNEMMKEIKRILKKSGLLIMSTPNKKVYSDVKSYINPFHVKELYINEFKDLLNAHFKCTQIFFQNMFKGSLIFPENINSEFSYIEGDFDSLNPSVKIAPMYIISISSDMEIGGDFKTSAFASPLIDLKGQEEIFNQTRENAVQWVRNSLTYKVGYFLLFPFKFFKK